MKLTAEELEILAAIKTEPGVTGAALMARGYGEDNPVYGRQRSVSRVIAKLRKLGLLADVRRRCEHCGSALTRGDKNVPLRAL